MNDLFIKTMKKLQENRRIERNSKVLKEDKHVDLEGEEKDIVTVIDPDLSTKEFKEKQQEVNDIINNTPEGENVVDTEYVGMKIYTCPLCLSNFYSEVEMDDEAQCPVCFETPDKFVYLGTVEQAASDSDEEAVEKAEQELDNSQPDEETDGEDEYELIDDDTEETDGEDKDEYELVDDTEENTDETDEEDNKLFASKQLNVKGKLFSEATEQLPEIHQKPRTGANKNYKKIDIYLDGKYFYSTKAFPTIKSAIEDCKKEYGNEVKGRKLKGMFADRKNESLLTEGGIYPVDLDEGAEEAFENKVGEILGGDVSVSNLELIPAKGFGGSGIYWFRATINVSDPDIIDKFINENTPTAKLLNDNNELIISSYSDISIEDDKYDSGITFDCSANCQLEFNMDDLDEDADKVGDAIIQKLRENQETLINLLKDYEVIDEEEYDDIEESKIGKAKLTEQKGDSTTAEKIQIILNYCEMEHFEPADLLKELQQYHLQESEFNELLLSLLLEYSTSEDNERYEEKYNSDDNYDSNYNMINKPSIQEVVEQLKEYLSHYDNREINEKILEMVIDVASLNVLNSWLNDLKKLTNYDDIMSWDDEKDEDEDNNDDDNDDDDNEEENDEEGDNEKNWHIIKADDLSIITENYPCTGCPILMLYRWNYQPNLFAVPTNELEGPFSSFEKIKLNFIDKYHNKNHGDEDESTISKETKQEFLQDVNEYCDALKKNVKEILNKDFESLYEKWTVYSRLDYFMEYLNKTYRRSLSRTGLDGFVITSIFSVIVCAFCNEDDLEPLVSRYEDAKLTDFLDSQTVNKQRELHDKKVRNENEDDDDEDYVEESLKSEDTGTIISDKTPAEAETTEVIPEIDIDDLCNSLQNSESINELGNIIIVIPDGEIKDNAKAAFDKCMSEYNFDTNYVANSITEAIHNTTNKLVSEAKITDYMTQQELDKAIKSNSILKNITNSYKVLDDMMIEVTSSVGKSYYKAILNDDGNIELYWISKDGKQLGDSFPLLSEDYKKLNEEVEAEGFKYNNKEYTGLDTYTYTFTLDQEDEFEKAKEELAKTGTVTEIFINNGYGLEYKKDKNI